MVIGIFTLTRIGPYQLEKRQESSLSRDGFNFYGGPSNRFHQIGEAVAPIVAFELGKSLMKSIQNEKEFTQPDVVPKLRENLINWYESNKKEVELIWTKKKGGKKNNSKQYKGMECMSWKFAPRDFQKKC